MPLGVIMLVHAGWAAVCCIRHGVVGDGAWLALIFAAKICRSARAGLLARKPCLHTHGWLHSPVHSIVCTVCATRHRIYLGSVDNREHCKVLTTLLYKYSSKKPLAGPHGWNPHPTSNAPRKSVHTLLIDCVRIRARQCVTALLTTGSIAKCSQHFSTSIHLRSPWLVHMVGTHTPLATRCANPYTLYL